MSPSSSTTEQLNSENVVDSEMGERQCDQIGRFVKVLGHKFSFKSSPNTG